MRSVNSYQDIESPEDERLNYSIECYAERLVDDYVEHTGHKPDYFTMCRLRKQARDHFSEGGEDDD